MARKGAITMPTVTIEEAQNKLGELIHRLNQGEEVVITENDQPVARLVPAAPPTEPRKVRQLGTLRGTVLSMERFDDPLEDFKEYME
jgi:prevent-host-death family protein